MDLFMYKGIARLRFLFILCDCTIFSFAELRRVQSPSSRHFLWSRVIKVILNKYEYKINYLANNDDSLPHHLSPDENDYKICTTN